MKMMSSNTTINLFLFNFSAPTREGNVSSHIVDCRSEVLATRFHSPCPLGRSSLTLVFVMRRSLGDNIIATSEVEKSISIIEISPDVPFSERGD